MLGKLNVSDDFYVSRGKFRGDSADEVAFLGGGAGGVDADWRIQTVHVDDIVNCKVITQGRIAGVRHGFITEVAAAFHVVVHAVRDDCVIPRVVDHAGLIRVVVQQGVPNLKGKVNVSVCRRASSRFSDKGRSF